LFGFWLFKSVSWIILFLNIVANFTHLYNYYCRNKIFQKTFHIMFHRWHVERRNRNCGWWTLVDSWLDSLPIEKRRSIWKIENCSLSLFFIRKIVLFLIFSHFFSFGSLTFVRRTFLLWNDSVKRLLILWFTSLTSSFDSSILNPIWLIVSL